MDSYFCLKFNNKQTVTSETMLSKRRVCEQRNFISVFPCFCTKCHWESRSPSICGIFMVIMSEFDCYSIVRNARPF